MHQRPNGGAPPYPLHARAVRNARYKLIRQVGLPDELYDLDMDTFEGTNLLPTLTPGEQTAYDALVAKLAIHASRVVREIFSALPKTPS